MTEAVRSALLACPTLNADLHVVSSASLSTPPREPQYELYTGIHGSPPEFAAHGPGADSELLFDFESARTHGIAIAGSDSQVVEFGRVPLEWLLAAADRVLAQWEGCEYFRQPHMAALQAARAWRLATDGTLTSKLSAGRWALERWPNPDLLAQALARQRGKCEALVDEPQAQALLAHARGAIPSRIGHPPQDR